MSLKEGQIEGGVYQGRAVCDCCGVSQNVVMTKDEIKGDGLVSKEGAVIPKWRHVPFKYRNWHACSDQCEKALNGIRERELTKDKTGGAEAWKVRAQRRPFPIPGTVEAIGFEPPPAATPVEEAT